MLLLGKHRHDNEGVQVDALAEHPEVVAAQQVEVENGEKLADHLEGERGGVKTQEPSNIGAGLM